MQQPMDTGCALPSPSPKSFTVPALTTPLGQPGAVACAIPTQHPPHGLTMARSGPQVSFGAAPLPMIQTSPRNGVAAGHLVGQGDSCGHGSALQQQQVMSVSMK